ncbi:MAG: hypothetical protein HQM00_04350, partial [Magnetococcales bacterium]|nr:hypothetical protein [Magnetococcales bacterium]
MSFFLEEPWLRVMREIGSISDWRAVALEGLPAAHVGVVRGWGQSRWVLYGSWEPSSGAGLPHLFQQARKAGVLSVESRFNMARWPEEQVRTLGAEVIEPFGTYRVDLRQSEEALWQGVHSKHRNVIRHARSHGVELVPELDREAFLSAMEATYRRGGRQNP